MKRIGILGAMELETALLSANIDGLVKQTKAGFVFLSGTIEGIEVVVAVCGVGKVNAAACTQLMIDMYSVDCIINTGIAGALAENLNPLDIVISSDVTHHDVRPAQLSSVFPFTRFFYADNQLINLAQEACSSRHLTGAYVIGRVASGESFIADDVERVRIREQLQACCVEMEGAAIGQVAYINNIPFVIIRTISDRADSGAALTYKEFEAVAADASARLVLAIIQRLRSSSREDERPA